MRRTLPAAGAAVLAALATLALGAPQAGASAPLVTLSQGVARPGESVTVEGSGFPDLIDVVAQVCGNDAIDASADCALSSSQEIATTSYGTFEVALVVEVPPVPCPCVVLVTSEHLDTTPSAPIEILGAPVAPLRPSAVAGVTEALEVLRVGLAGSGPWTAWFGAEPRRTLVLRVRNPNSATYPDPPLVLRQGPPGQPGSVVSTGDLGSFAPYQTRTLLVPVTLSPLAVGAQEVHGTLGFTGYDASFRDDTVVVPWGLVALALVVIQLVLLAIRNRVRRRVAATAPPGADGAAQAAHGFPVVVGPPPGPEGGSLPAAPVPVAPPASDRRPLPAPTVPAGRPGPPARPLAVSAGDAVVEPAALGAASRVLAPSLRSRLGHGDRQGEPQVLALVDIRAEGEEPAPAAISSVVRLLQVHMRADDLVVPVGPRTIGAVCSTRPRGARDPSPPAAPGAGEGKGEAEDDPAARLASRLAALAEEAMEAASIRGGCRAVAVWASAATGADPVQVVRHALAGLAAP
jgi:hypothetical protein